MPEISVLGDYEVKVIVNAKTYKLVVKVVL